MLCKQVSSLVERDLRTIWHPFTQRAIDPHPIPLIKGKGAYLYSENGEKYLDGVSSWWVNLHGHAHPSIVKAITEQSEMLDQVMFTDFTHPKAVDLAERLLILFPGFSKIFYSDNGSTSVECALKMVIQYWFSKKILRKKILSLKGGYHGDTFGAMSAAGKNSLNLPFWPYLFEVVTLDLFSENCLEHLKKHLKTSACIIYEPLVQGVGGMRILPKKNLNAVLELCKEAGVLLIADEVMTGFGRTGTLFASEQLTVEPDLICLSKGLTGGFLPMGVTVVKEWIYEAFLSKNRKSAFLHGHSYTANPVICAAALASLDLLLSSECGKYREMIEKEHCIFCIKHKDSSILKRLESLGTILSLEFKGESGYSASIRDHLIRHFHSHGIILRPLGNILYVLPPYCIERPELQIIYQAIEELL